MQYVHTTEAAQALGHYSQAIISGGFVFVSGQIPIYPDGTLETGSVAEQTRVALHNVNSILQAAGTSKENVVKATVFIADIAIWPEVNGVYAEFFGTHKPARSAVPANGLPKGAAVEIEVIAAL